MVEGVFFVLFFLFSFFFPFLYLFLKAQAPRLIIWGWDGITHTEPNCALKKRKVRKGFLFSFPLLAGQDSIMCSTVDFSLVLGLTFNHVSSFTFTVTFFFFFFFEWFHLVPCLLSHCPYLGEVWHTRARVRSRESFTRLDPPLIPPLQSARN